MKQRRVPSVLSPANSAVQCAAMAERNGQSTESPFTSWWEREPLAAVFRNGPGDEQRIEFSSRGDRVSGWLKTPSASGPPPLVVLGHGAGLSTSDPRLVALASAWCQRGAAVAAFDLPLHGARKSDKLSDALLEAMGEPERLEHPDALRLCCEFLVQAKFDLRRAIDALCLEERVDRSRIAYAGFSLGAMVGAHLCADEPRVACAVLAFTGGGGHPAVDAAAALREATGRPLLLVQSDRDERVSRRARERLESAADPEARSLTVSGRHGELRGSELKTIWTFLAGQLAI